MNYSNKSSLKNVMGKLKDLSLKTLPTFLGLIPAIGVPLGAGMEVIIGCSEIYDESKKKEELNKQLNNLKEIIANHKIDEESLVKNIKISLMERLKSELEINYVYAYGIILYVNKEDELDEDDKWILDKLLSCESLECNSELEKKLAQEIKDFMEEYCGEGCISANDDYFIMDNQISINFGCDSGAKYIRDDNKVRNFIDALNWVLHDNIIEEYSFF